MSNSHTGLVRAIIFACVFPLSAAVFAASAKTTVASEGVAQSVVRIPPQAAVTSRTPIRVVMR